MDLSEAVTYRLAFGLADQLREANEHRLAGRYASNSAAGGTVEAIFREVCHRLPVRDESERELAREACEDAVSGRRPKW